MVNNGEVPTEILKRYSQDNSSLVINDRKKVEGIGYRVVEEDFIMITDGVIRHDPERLAKIILSFIEEI